MLRMLVIFSSRAKRGDPEYLVNMTSTYQLEFGYQDDQDQRHKTDA